MLHLHAHVYVRDVWTSRREDSLEQDVWKRLSGSCRSQPAAGSAPVSGGGSSYAVVADGSDGKPSTGRRGSTGERLVTRIKTLGRMKGEPSDCGAAVTAEKENSGAVAAAGGAVTAEPAAAASKTGTDRGRGGSRKRRAVSRYRSRKR